MGKPEMLWFTAWEWNRYANRYAAPKQDKELVALVNELLAALDSIPPLHRGSAVVKLLDLGGPSLVVRWCRKQTSEEVAADIAIAQQATDEQTERELYERLRKKYERKGVAEPTNLYDALRVCHPAIRRIDCNLLCNGYSEASGEVIAHILEPDNMKHSAVCATALEVEQAVIACLKAHMPGFSLSEVRTGVRFAQTQNEPPSP